MPRLQVGAKVLLHVLTATTFQHHYAFGFVIPSSISHNTAHSLVSKHSSTSRNARDSVDEKPAEILSELNDVIAEDAVNNKGSESSSSPEPFFLETTLDDDRDAPLMKDIELVSNVLAEVVRRENEEVHDIFMRFRQHGLDRAQDISDAEPLQKMIECAKDLTPTNALGVMRLFAIALNLINAAEVQHRMRCMRQSELAADQISEVSGPLPMTEDSVRGTIQKILDENTEVTKDEIIEQLLKQKVEIVLTAHPTEVNRRTLLKKYRRVTEQLALLDREDLNPYERTEAVSTLRRIVAAIWGSDEIRRQKPTPQQEALGGIAILESVLWDAVPAYLRKLDAQLRLSLGHRLPVDVVPIKFASWIGGDRDGNPNVTPIVTLEVVNQQRLRAARLYLQDLDDLYGELAVSSRFSDEMVELAETITNSKDIRELYRRVIGDLELRLMKTVKESEAQLLDLAKADQMLFSSDFAARIEKTNLDSVAPIMKSNDLMDPLMTIHRSLVETGFEEVADGLLLDIIRRVSAFSMTLVPLDIREESTRHTLALDAITRYLGVGSYAEWDEQTRLNFLQTELSSKRPLFRTRDLDSFGFDADVLKTLKCFYMASTLDPDALGAYVISQAQTASDVMAVVLLQKQFGMNADMGNAMRVVPLFETLDDLQNSSDVLDTLFSIAPYVGSIKGKQEVMVGYSDSAKDAGRLAANWALYENQEQMVEVAQKYNIELTFFHGKGGTVGRGGNPALYRAILSHPPNTIQGRFRVTEQGEMITQNFGAPSIAERTLDIYTAAVLREAFVKHVEPKEEWRDQMRVISESSCADYRQLVREEPAFVPYFRQATPELELGSLNIGSRPAKRNPKGGIESLRAIPWTFAWTQTRTNLSAWLGVGSALQGDPQHDATMREMYKEWPWFRETIDLVGMILSKTDFSISKNYDDQLVQKTDELNKLGDSIRDKLVLSRKGVLEVTGKTEGAGPHVQLLRASTKVRSPYLDPINVVQAELLKRLRSTPEDSQLSDVEVKDRQKLQDALIMSINGIAQGMRNSG